MNAVKIFKFAGGRSLTKSSGFNGEITSGGDRFDPAAAENAINEFCESHNVIDIMVNTYSYANQYDESEHSTFDGTKIVYTIVYEK